MPACDQQAPIGKEAVSRTKQVDRRGVRISYPGLWSSDALAGLRIPDERPALDVLVHGIHWIVGPGPSPPEQYFPIRKHVRVYGDVGKLKCRQPAANITRGWRLRRLSSLAS